MQLSTAAQYARKGVNKADINATSAKGSCHLDHSVMNNLFGAAIPMQEVHVDFADQYQKTWLIHTIL